MVKDPFLAFRLGKSTFYSVNMNVFCQVKADSTLCCILKIADPQVHKYYLLFFRAHRNIVFNSRDTKKLIKLLRKASSLVAAKLTAEGRMRRKLKADSNYLCLFG